MIKVAKTLIHYLWKIVKKAWELKILGVPT